VALRELVEPGALLGDVGAVLALESVESGIGELTHERVQRVVREPQRSGVRDRAHPARRVGQVDRVLGTEAVALEVRGSALAEPRVERLLDGRRVAFLH
jgi:hypothetical protein